MGFSAAELPWDVLTAMKAELQQAADPDETPSTRALVQGWALGGHVSLSASALATSSTEGQGRAEGYAEGGDTGMTINAEGGDTGMSINAEGGDTGMTINAEGGDTGMTIHQAWP